MSRRIEVLFEFQVELYKKVKLYRAVRQADGKGFRMEDKGPDAKKFKPFMWTGSEDGIVGHYRSIQWAVKSTFGKIKNAETAEAWVAQFEKRAIA